MRARAWRTDESGASLAMVLIFVTVVAVVVGAVLSFADVNFRTTIVLRQQAESAAAADGAAQIAINALRNGSYGGTGTCFTSPSTNLFQLPGFYQVPGAANTSAAVSCEPDADSSASGGGVVIGSANRPNNAILTFNDPLFFEDGLRAVIPNGATMKVHGGVFSNNNINVDVGTLGVDSYVKGRTGCSGSITSTPAKQCPYFSPDPAGEDPNYSPPPGTNTNGSVPSCAASRRVVNFSPGRYQGQTIANQLNALTDENGTCRNSIYAFAPGVYYFDLPDPWRIETGFVVAGQPTVPFVNGTSPTVPGACKSPFPPSPAGAWTPQGAAGGAQFVLGGETQIKLSNNAQMELCGTYSATAPAIALYGLKQDTAVGSIDRQDGCVITKPYPFFGCAAFTAESANRVYIQGTTYLPRAAIELKFDNPSGQLFSAGVIARMLRVSPSSGANLTNPIIGLPTNSTGGAKRTVVFLVVHVCPAVASCDESGPVRLRVKVGLTDTSGTPVPGSRQVTVLSWSTAR